MVIWNLRVTVKVYKVSLSIVSKLVHQFCLILLVKERDSSDSRGGKGSDAW